MNVVITETGKEIHFASVEVVQPNNRLALAPLTNQATKNSLLKLPCFQSVETQDLIVLAEKALRGRKKIGDRLTAILVLIGAQPFTHAKFQVVPEKDAQGVARYVPA